MSQNPSLFFLLMEEKFDGLNWMTFKMIITEATCRQGLLGYLMGDIEKPTPKFAAAAVAMMWGTALPTMDKWLQHNAFA